MIDISTTTSVNLLKDKVKLTYIRMYDRNISGWIDIMEKLEDITFAVTETRSRKKIHYGAVR